MVTVEGLISGAGFFKGLILSASILATLDPVVSPGAGDFEKILFVVVLLLGVENIVAKGVDCFGAVDERAKGFEGEDEVGLLPKILGSIFFYYFFTYTTESFYYDFFGSTTGGLSSFFYASTTFGFSSFFSTWTSLGFSYFFSASTFGFSSFFTGFISSFLPAHFLLGSIICGERLIFSISAMISLSESLSIAFIAETAYFR